MADVKPERLDPPVDNPPPPQKDSRARRIRRLLTPPSLEHAQQQIQIHHVRLIWLFQGIVWAASFAICWKVGASWWFLGTSSAAFGVFCVLIGRRMMRYARTPDALPRGSLVLRLMRGGVWATSAGFWLLAWAVLLRTNWSGEGSTFYFAVAACLVVVGWATLHASSYSIAHGTTPWFQFSVGVTLLPFLFAWLIASLFVAFVPPYLAARGVNQPHDEHKRRALWAENPSWRGADGRPLTVAVALSGGGYRAATFHAGVLKTLDEHCVPIRYLTTVSGGSIVGTYYALGYSPHSFKARLIAGKPGLADSMLTIWWVAMDLWWPGWNSADTYSWHFRKVFFGERTLEDTGRTPQLIVNATDIERKPADSRDVFYKDRDTRIPRLNRTPLADFVAASGAFPGPFQPKEIEWPFPPSVQEDASQPPPDCEKDFESKACFARRQFADGGVRENLGYTGLSLFIVTEITRAIRRKADPPPLPDILILSDASAPSREVDLPAKVDVLTLLARSSDISYQTYHDLLRIMISNGSNLPTGLTMHTEWIRSQYDDAERALDGTQFPADGDGGSVAGKEIARAVNGYDTLLELEPDMVRRAFWLGETLAAKRWAEVDAWRQKLAKGPSCAAAAKTAP